MGVWAVAGALGVGLIAAPAAQATFHLMQIREIYPGTLAGPESEYVELQMWSGGQNHVQGHFLRTYDAGGALVATSTFPADVPQGANQSTIVLATPKAEEQFGIVGDASLSGPGLLSPAGGAVCWEAIDCASWGSFSGSLPSPAGSPASAAGIPDGMSLRRTIARGCATALDPADDSDDSAADFSPAAPLPRPNSVAPSEQACASGGPGAAPGSPNQNGVLAPQTLLRRLPPKRSRDRTPTFRFASDIAAARFECRLDRKPFRRCRAPFTTRVLAFGPHRFRVRAIAGGLVDPSPASYRFKVLRGPVTGR
jgi:hypothetical protein